ncbi:hypothetical protein M427DRAFT_153083 [Gonapodya prolifera JEL478]|uniref:Pentacotripeptide-repeat region of PRORP domain-containing protein n=1 Tax=Gonapodya prolifera (strain JEL478) TaxID=1344416 RepID=A0A139APQ8_GONPJ|nr:hypothetical protein M427DRAFT_153083 [Gonapodya prolifera JEL478]|eukprot:KXS18712.1 hypothetical protein M427DRAFT_153083 [Gonapodya prolifera JEL478]
MPPNPPRYPFSTARLASSSTSGTIRRRTASLGRSSITPRELNPTQSAFSDRHRRSLHLWGFGKWIGEQEDGADGRAGTEGSADGKSSTRTPLPPHTPRTSRPSGGATFDAALSPHFEEPTRPAARTRSPPRRVFELTSDQMLYSNVSQQILDSLHSSDTQAAWDAYSKMLEESLEKVELSVWDHRTLLGMLVRMPPVKHENQPSHSHLTDGNSRSVRGNEIPASVETRAAPTGSGDNRTAPTATSLMLRVLSDMHARGINLTGRDFRPLMNRLLANEDLLGAQELVRVHMPAMGVQPDILMWNFVIKTALAKGNWDMALATVEEMKIAAAKTYDGSSMNAKAPYPDATIQSTLLRHLVRTAKDYPAAISLWDSFWSDTASHPASPSTMTRNHRVPNALAMATGLVMEACVGIARVDGVGLSAARRKAAALAGWDSDVPPLPGMTLDRMSPIGWLLDVGSAEGQDNAPGSPRTAQLVPQVVAWYITALLDLSMPMHALRIFSATSESRAAFPVPFEVMERMLTGVLDLQDVTIEELPAILSVSRGLKSIKVTVGRDILWLAATGAEGSIHGVLTLAKDWVDQGRNVEWVHRSVAAVCTIFVNRTMWDTVAGCVLGYSAILAAAPNVPKSLEDAIQLWRSGYHRDIMPDRLEENLALAAIFLPSTATVLSMWDAGAITLPLLGRVASMGSIKTNIPAMDGRVLSRVVTAQLASGHHREAKAVVMAHRKTWTNPPKPGCFEPANAYLHALLTRDEALVWPQYEEIGAADGYNFYDWGDAQTFSVLARTVKDIASAARFVKAVEESGVDSVPVDAILCLGDLLEMAGKEAKKEDEGALEALAGWMSTWRKKIPEGGLVPA